MFHIHVRNSWHLFFGIKTIWVKPNMWNLNKNTSAFGQAGKRKITRQNNATQMWTTYLVFQAQNRFGGLLLKFRFNCGERLTFHFVLRKAAAAQTRESDIFLSSKGLSGSGKSKARSAMTFGKLPSDSGCKILFLKISCALNFFLNNPNTVGCFSLQMWALQDHGTL